MTATSVATPAGAVAIALVEWSYEPREDGVGGSSCLIHSPGRERTRVRDGESHVPIDHPVLAASHLIR